MTNSDIDSPIHLEKIEFHDLRIADLKYQSELINLRNIEDRELLLKNKNEKEKFIQKTFELQKTKDITETIIELEKENTVFIFKKLSLLKKITTESSQSDNIYIIHPSGAFSTVSPMISSRRKNSFGIRYEVEYHPETICIGFAIKNNSETKAISILDIDETTKNGEEILKYMSVKENEIIRIEDKKQATQSELIALEEQANRLKSTLKFFKDQNTQNEKIIEEQNKTIAALEQARDRIAKENSETDLQSKKLRRINEEIKEQNDELEKRAAQTKTNILECDTERQSILAEIAKLKIEKSQFDNELSGYANEGAKQSKAYYAVTFLVMMLITIVTTHILFNGVEFIKEYNTTNNANILELILSRVPLTVGVSIILTFSFTLIYIMIKNIIKINSDRMRFLQASIIAKDIYYATESTEGINIIEREKLRQEAKIKIISKIFESEQYSNVDTKIAEILIEKLTKSS